MKDNKQQRLTINKGDEMDHETFIKTANKKEQYGNKPKQDAMRKLSTMYNGNIVYKPYGKNGKGFYLITNI